jgi:putative CocE/NonD family hydrolase
VAVEDVAIPMRDGVELTATVFRDPGAAAPVPVIAAMTPYLREGYDQWEGFRDPPLGHVSDFYMGTVEISDHTAFEAPDPGHWVPRGYAVVLIDYPGRGGSGSRPEDPPQFAQRWADAMAWMEAQPWCSGKVGLSGVSAPTRRRSSPRWSPGRASTSTAPAAATAASPRSASSNG